MVEILKLCKKPARFFLGTSFFIVQRKISLNILITNDDGISSNGIKALEEIFQQKHNTFLIAPLKEKSATSQALNIHSKMRVERVNDNHYIVDGYPVDCVNIGIHGNIFPKIDMVISGINRGMNMGYDVHYSGTVGAARHASIHNILAFAVSSGNLTDGYTYLDEAKILLNFIDQNLSLFQKKTVYNINFPIEYDKINPKFVPANLGVRTYVDVYKAEFIIGGISDYFLGGSELGYIALPDTDFEVYSKNQIPISPLQLDSTNQRELSILKVRLS